MHVYKYYYVSDFIMLRSAYIPGVKIDAGALCSLIMNVYSKRRLDKPAKPLRYSNNNIISTLNIKIIDYRYLKNTHCSANNYTYTILMLLLLLPFYIYT